MEVTSFVMTLDDNLESLLLRHRTSSVLRASLVHYLTPRGPARSYTNNGGKLNYAPPLICIWVMRPKSTSLGLVLEACR